MMVFIAVLLISLIAQTTGNEYCDVCANHTLCIYNETSLGKTCENSSSGGISDEEKSFILQQHNWFRRKVAKGLEERGINGSQPKAANMLKMYWDDELAKAAQRWADQCQFQHDSCRNFKRWNVGQNIYWNWRFPIVAKVNWTSALYSWFDEVEQFHSDSVESYDFDANTGHYSQLVWHDSNLIGCGQRSYGPNKIYICNYGPTGNWLQESVYYIGDPCSQCPVGNICEDGLCADANLQHSNMTNLLTPPEENAISIYEEYNNVVTETIETTEADIGLPIHLNVINDLDIPDDADIRDEIEDLKRRIRALVNKITERKSQKQLIS